MTPNIARPAPAPRLGWFTGSFAVNETAGLTRRIRFAKAAGATYDVCTMRPALGVPRVFLVAVTLAASLAAWREREPQESAPALWAGLKPGAYRVGYRRITSAGGVVHAWYPTAASGRRLRFREYVAGDSARLASFLGQTGLTRTTIDRLFASSLYAAPAPPPLARNLPLVLVAQGNGQDAIDQVVLCEYLASHGFVVASTPSPMLRTPMQREDQVGELAEAQATDLVTAIEAATTDMVVRTERIGLIGHSFGARSALLLAMRDRRIAAIVSLDGGIGTATAVEPFRRAASFSADASLPPLLHFYEELDAFMKPDFTLLRALRFEDLVLERTVGMRHVHFTTYGFAASAFPAFGAATRADSSTAGGVANVAQLTLAFIRRHVR
jgi:dienelactone hydrolase